MSWAQLTNRPNNVSHQYNNNYNNHNNHHHHHNTYYRKSNNNINRIKTYNNAKVETTSSKRKHNDVSYVILDSGAFIGRQSFFNNFSQNVTYYMTPAVNHEIRDKQSRQFLDNFPYQIIVKKPEPQSVQYVSKFISKNPNLRSLSKVDRQIIALAHTLELEKEGNKNILCMDNNNKQNKNGKAMSMVGDNKNNQRYKKQIKKSKTGRIHRQAEPLNDTGLRLAKLKKVIPFHFDDFMTMSKAQYGSKYGTPTPIEMIVPGSPKFKLKKDIIKSNDSKEKDMDNKSESNVNVNVNANETKIKYKANIRAKTEASASDIAALNEDMANISKSQRRRKRKKILRAQDNKNMTQDNLLVFGMIDDEEKESDHDSDNDNVDEILNNVQIEKDIKEIKLDDENHIHNEQKTSDIDKMIEEDLNNTFNETASLISSLSAQSAQHKQQINDINKRLNIIKKHPKNNNNNNATHGQPVMDNQSQSHPVISFGTMFNGAKGSLFGDDNDSKGDTSNAIVAKPIESAVVGNNRLAPLQQSKTQLQSQPQPQPLQKKTVNDAWNGQWLSPDNFKNVPKNANNKKKKLQHADNTSNAHSSVAVVTVDMAMQRCMVEMGIRVLTTSSDRQYGGGQQRHRQNNNQNNNQNQNNNNQNNRRNYNNGEAVDYIFRCFGCFQYEHNTSRTHCRWCGGQTYQRVAIYEDDAGKHHYRYYYRDRYGHKYLDKHSLVPRGSQLVKYNQTNHKNNQYNRNQKKKKKKRAYLGNNNNYRGGGGGQRW